MEVEHVWPVPNQIRDGNFLQTVDGMTEEGDMSRQPEPVLPEPLMMALI